MAAVILPIPKQHYTGIAGLPLVGGKVYTFAAGTSTPKATYTDEAATTPQPNPIILNSRGEPASAIYWSGAYKVELRDALNNLIYTVDNINSDPTGFSSFLTTIMSSAGSAIVGFIQAGVGAIARFVQDKLRESVSAEDYYNAADGAAADTLAIQRAITYLVSVGGGRLELTKNTYTLTGVAGADGQLNGILIPFTGGLDAGATSTSIEIVGKSRDTKLLAGSNNMNVIRLSAAYCSIRNLAIHANGQTGVTGLAMIPENTSAPANQSQQSFNQIENLFIYQCADGITLQCGGIGGAYYNKFSNIHIHGGSLNGTRCLYLKTGVGGGTPSNVNRNQFYSVRMGYANTGVDLESGDTNSFFGCSAEGISIGNLPNATPTAIIVDNVDGHGRGNEHNRFISFTAEACTRDLDCQNARTVFDDCLIDGSKMILSAAFADSGTMIGNYDRSVTPTIEDGRVSNGGTLPVGMSATDYEVGATSGGFPIVEKGGKFKAFTLTAANVQGIDSIADARSFYQYSNGYVEWGFRFAFNPTATNSIIRVTAPKTAHLALYAQFATLQPLLIPVAIVAGATQTVGFARFNFNAGTEGQFLEILLPGATLWDNTAGDNNQVHVNIIYKAV